MIFTTDLTFQFLEIFNVCLMLSALNKCPLTMRISVEPEEIFCFSGDSTLWWDLLLLLLIFRIMLMRWLQLPSLSSAQSIGSWRVRPIWWCPSSSTSTERLLITRWITSKLTMLKISRLESEILWPKLNLKLISKLSILTIFQLETTPSWT